MASSSSWTLPGEPAGITLLYDFLTEAEERYVLEVSPAPAEAREAGKGKSADRRGRVWANRKLMRSEGTDTRLVGGPA